LCYTWRYILRSSVTPITRCIRITTRISTVWLTPTTSLSLQNFIDYAMSNMCSQCNQWQCHNCQKCHNKGGILFSCHFFREWPGQCISFDLVKFDCQFWQLVFPQIERLLGYSTFNVLVWGKRGCKGVVSGVGMFWRLISLVVVFYIAVI
jgi:hypothetical protein